LIAIIEKIFLMVSTESNGRMDERQAGQLVRARKRMETEVVRLQAN
jgi:hypothetical protein